MQLLKQFSLNSKLKKINGLKSCLPIRNGGLKSIKRDVITKYCDKKLAIGKASL